jgi:F-type H+-transporting ATPase subunit alpha
MPVELQVLSVFAGTSGALDDLEVDQIRRFEGDMHEWFQARHGALLDQIRATGALPDGDELAEDMADFKQTFTAALAGEAQQAAAAAETPEPAAAAAE